MTDKDGDEEDGYDEILIPGDYKVNGHILDDWLFSEFVTKIEAGVHVVAIVDCCHSGTAMDLPYVCGVGENEIRRSEGFKMPATGMELTPKKKDKEKKKKKSTTDKKVKKSDKKEKEKKSTKKKSSKKKDEEVEPEPDEQESELEEVYEPEPEPEPEEEYEPEPEPQEETKKKKKGLFGFGKKK